MKAKIIDKIFSRETLLITWEPDCPLCCAVTLDFTMEPAVVFHIPVPIDIAEKSRKEEQENERTNEEDKTAMQ